MPGMGTVANTAGAVNAAGASGADGASVSSIVTTRLHTHGMIRRLRVEGNFDLGVVKWPTGLREVVLAGEYNRDFFSVSWPRGLVKLVIDGVFDAPIAVLRDDAGGRGSNRWVRNNKEGGLLIFPGDLEELVLAGNFNQDVVDVVWPSGLRRLTLGGVGDYTEDYGSDDEEPSFNKAIVGVRWPSVLTTLIFGDMFNQPLAGANFPDKLEEIVLGDRFNKPIDEVKWPNGLRRLKFGEDFDMEIQDVRWPDGLEDIEFGADFCQSLDAVSWPKSIRKLTFGSSCDVGPLFGSAEAGLWMERIICDGVERQALLPYYDFCTLHVRY